MWEWQNVTLNVEGIRAPRTERRKTQRVRVIDPRHITKALASSGRIPDRLGKNGTFPYESILSPVRSQMTEFLHLIAENRAALRVGDTRHTKAVESCLP